MVGSHHLAREIVGLGHKVVHLSTPVTPLHFVRARGARIMRDRAAIWRDGGRVRGGGFLEYVPLGLVPWAAGGSLFERTGVNLSNVTLPSIRRYLRTKGFREVDALLIDQPAFIGLDRLVAARSMFARSTDVIGPERGSARRTAEAAIARAADGLVATSRLALEDLRRSAPDKPHALIENGVQVEHFMTAQAAPADLRAIRRPIVIFAGAIDERFDLDATLTLARSCPDLSIVLIGPKPPDVPSRPAENVHVLGSRSYDHLPGYLQQADLGLMPFNDHPSNAGRSPMKLYEYAAAGLQVVARRTPELERRNERFLHFYDSASDLPAACRAALASTADRASVAACAAPHGWTQKARDLLQFVAAVLAEKEKRLSGEVPAGRPVADPNMRFGHQT